MLERLNFMVWVDDVIYSGLDDVIYSGLDEANLLNT